MYDNQLPEYANAVSDFRDARRRAAIQDLLARFRGKTSNLLPFDETKRMLKGRSAIYLGLKEIPLDAITGSVGRYMDFTRSFLPRRGTDEYRWARVKANIPHTGFNPIEVYQVGEVYFVLDGNHRVSIARARGDLTIQAYVTQILTKVPLSPEDSPDDLIHKAELTDFLEQTHFDVSRPMTDFQTTAPGAYNILNQEISRYRPENPNMKWEKLAIKWHDEEYLPFVQGLREKGLRRDFPGRTETDLYAWIRRRQGELIEEIGWEVPFSVAADNLLEKSSKNIRRVFRRVHDRLSDLAMPDPLEAGPRAGSWRQWALSTHREDHLFTDYLVPISGSPESWIALEQALVLARLEQDYVHGLHVVSNEREAVSEKVARIQTDFEARLREENVLGELKVEVGSIPRIVCDYAAWADLVIMNIVHPPGNSPINKITSGLHTIIHRSPRPLFLVPSMAKYISKLLLAYDGSPKAHEAMYISAYLAGKWDMELTVLTVGTNRTSINDLQSAKNYLEGQKIRADYQYTEGNPADSILSAADKTKCHAILMGGYGFRPVIEMVLGSAVDRVLHEANVPVILCR